jgi:hypothetical protein
VKVHLKAVLMRKLLIGKQNLLDKVMLLLNTVLVIYTNMVMESIKTIRLLLIGTQNLLDKVMLMLKTVFVELRKT